MFVLDMIDIVESRLERPMPEPAKQKRRKVEGPLGCRGSILIEGHKFKLNNFKFIIDY